MTSRRVALACTMAAVASIAVLAPAFELRTGVTYRDLTVAEWERKILEWDIVDDTLCRAPTGLITATPPRTLPRIICELFEIPLDNRLALLEGEPAALDVLLELLDSPHADVRRVAIQGLAKIKPPGRIVMPHLLVAARDPDHKVRYLAIMAIDLWDRETATRLRRGL